MIYSKPKSKYEVRWRESGLLPSEIRNQSGIDNSISRGARALNQNPGFFSQTGSGDGDCKGGRSQFLLSSFFVQKNIPQRLSSLPPSDSLPVYVSQPPPPCHALVLAGMLVLSAMHGVGVSSPTHHKSWVQAVQLNIVSDLKYATSHTR